MLRTFNDLARAARVEDIVTRSICGHATERMQHEELQHWLQKMVEQLAFARLIAAVVILVTRLRVLP